MSGHTPGPWKVEYENNDGARVSAIASVAWCPSSAAFGADGSQVITADEAEANARLIAAAPDLLAALEAVMATRTTPWRKDAMKANQLAIAAIAKARGEP